MAPEYGRLGLAPARRSDEFVSKPAFEDIVRVDARDAVGRDPAFPVTAEIGAWWGPVPDERFPGSRRIREGEIDLVGYEGRRLVLAGEAKWSSAPEDGAALAQLRRVVVHVPDYDAHDTRLATYSRSGFTDDFRRRATLSREAAPGQSYAGERPTCRSPS